MVGESLSKMTMGWSKDSKTLPNEYNLHVKTPEDNITSQGGTQFNIFELINPI